MTDAELQERIAAIPYWYHAIPMRPNIVTPGWAPLVPEAYRVPERMDGELVLDVGAWDGYWTFEAVKRGGSCLAMDDFSDTCGELANADRSKEWATFDLCKEALGYKDEQCDHITADAETLQYLECWNPVTLDTFKAFEFDRVFCFGLLYHVKNPLKVLEGVHSVLKPGGTIHVETAIIDNIQSPYTKSLPPENACYAEFYPTNEFGKNQSNWWVPTLKCAASWLHAVGFRDIEMWKLTDSPQSLAECRGFLKAVKQ